MCGNGKRRFFILAAAARGKGGLEPTLAPIPPAACERKCRIAIQTRVGEGGAVAEAFADIIAPGVSFADGTARFLDLGRFAELALDSRSEFAFKKTAELGTLGIA